MDTLTIFGDIVTNSIFDLKGKTITNLTINLVGMSNGEKLTLTNGTVKNLTVKDKAGVALDVNSVVVENRTNLN